MTIFRSRRGVQLGARQVRASRELQRRQRRLQRLRVTPRPRPLEIRIVLTTRVVEQWVNRVAPQATQSEARGQLQTFLRDAVIVDETKDSDGLYLGSPGWPEWVVAIRPKRESWWLARTVLVRRNLWLE